MPTNVSAFTNDAGYLTQHQDISGKADSSSLATVATSGSYNDLNDTPIIPDVSGFYTKPEDGIPASDLATGIVPDLSLYATKNNPALTGNLTLGSGCTSTGGIGAVATGWTTTATGRSAHAEGQSTLAEG